jgi:uncharacterized protein YprB with RNaseH-like and TPR domain
MEAGAQVIRNSFCMLPGIGVKREQRLWDMGIRCWDDFLGKKDIVFILGGKKLYYDDLLKEVLRAVDERNSGFLSRNIPRTEHWRLFQDFRNHGVALDIETNGCMPDDGGYVTVVGLYDGTDYRALIRGRDLNRETLGQVLSQYSYLITFYGSVFDMPFLKKVMGVELSVPHFDLCFAGRRAGFRGGLKRIEKVLSIGRDETVDGMDGLAAVKLWDDFMSGSDQSLEILINYNRYDTVNLFKIAEIIFDKLKIKSGFIRGSQG